MALGWKIRGAIYVGLCLAHLMGAIAILSMQSVCYQPPCIDSMLFNIVRGFWMFPLFHTPIADFPAQDLEMARDAALFGWLVANAAVACALYGLAYYGVSRYRASSACNATRGT